MTPQEIKNQRSLNFRQTNAFAMQYGAVMGVYVIVAQACFVLGLTTPALMNVQTLLTILFPLVVVGCALHFRKQVSAGIPFAFGRGFSFALLVVLYAGVWASLAVLVYLQWFDHGYLFDTYEHLVEQPDMVKAMQESGLTSQVQAATGGLTPGQVVAKMREIPASTFAAALLYFFILSAPLIAILAGAFSMRRHSRGH